MQDNSQLSPQDLELIKAAQEHLQKLYTKDVTTIAAALRTKNGKIYTGINYKYHCSNLNPCAERMALDKALDDGEKEFDSIVAVKYFPEENRFEIVNSCGLCRQAFAYHAPLRIITSNDGVLKPISAADLLPFAFV